MNNRLDSTLPAVPHTAQAWVPVFLRLLVVGLLAGPAVSKFLTYDSSVAFFGAIGIPYPAVAVIVVGIIELAALAMLGFGFAGRAAALALLPVMVVAMLASGLDWKNTSVLFGAAALVIVGTGPYSAWQPITSDRVKAFA